MRLTLSLARVGFSASRDDSGPVGAGGGSASTRAPTCIHDRASRRLQSAQATLEDTDQTVQEAKRTLKVIGFNIAKEKLTLIFVIVCLMTVRASSLAPFKPDDFSYLHSWTSFWPTAW